MKPLALALIVLLSLPAPAQAAGATITVTSPVDYQVMQRNSSNKANILITGKYTGNPKTIQARWNNGPWTTIDKTLEPSSGTFRGVLPGQSAGQGLLQARFSNMTGLIDGVFYVGVGDVFVMAGQSNMSGRGHNLQTYKPATALRASVFGNNDKWGMLKDPYDSPTGQVDKVSSDNAGGSWVAQFANEHSRRTGVPVAFIPAARGGSTIAQWGWASSPSTLYGSMWRRVKAAGGKAVAVLWFQGENDSNTTADTYRVRLSSFGTHAFQDFGAVTIPAIIGSAPYDGPYRAGVRMGTLAAVRQNEPILMGPAFYDVNIDDEGGDGMHFTSDEDLQIVGQRFWRAVDAALYGGDRGYGPELEEATRAGTTIRLRFDTDIEDVTAVSESFWVATSEGRIPVQSFAVDGDTVILELGQPVPDGVRVSLGYDNRSGIGHALYGAGGLPVVPFHNVTPM